MEIALPSSLLAWNVPCYRVAFVPIRIVPEFHHLASENFEIADVPVLVAIAVPLVAFERQENSNRSDLPHLESTVVLVIVAAKFVDDGDWTDRDSIPTRKRKPSKGQSIQHSDERIGRS